MADIIKSYNDVARRNVDMLDGTYSEVITSISQNMTNKFREAFEAYDPVSGGKWTESKPLAILSMWTEMRLLLAILSSPKIRCLLALRRALRQLAEFRCQLKPLLAQACLSALSGRNFLLR